MFQASLGITWRNTFFPDQGADQQDPWHSMAQVVSPSWALAAFGRVRDVSHGHPSCSAEGHLSDLLGWFIYSIAEIS